jgi:hypothetical protein
MANDDDKLVSALPHGDLLERDRILEDRLTVGGLRAASCSATPPRARRRTVCVRRSMSLRR